MPERPTFLSEVPFGAYLVYSPRGKSETSRKSQQLVADIKQDRNRVLDRIAKRLRQDIDKPGLKGLRKFLDPSAILVPVPTSAPLVKKALWPSRRICRCLLAEGFGSTMREYLRRAKAVRKSAFAPPGERPDPIEHYKSLAIHAETVDAPERILLVDDVVTKGCTLLAAASRLHAAFPDAEIRAFALVRTMGFIPDVERINDPCVGKISCVGDGFDADRKP